jgi:hypothetical protein
MKLYDVTVMHDRRCLLLGPQASDRLERLDRSVSWNQEPCGVRSLTSFKKQLMSGCRRPHAGKMAQPSTALREVFFGTSSHLAV